MASAPEALLPVKLDNQERTDALTQAMRWGMQGRVGGHRGRPAAPYPRLVAPLSLPGVWKPSDDWAAFD